MEAMNAETLHGRFGREMVSLRPPEGAERRHRAAAFAEAELHAVVQRYEELRAGQPDHAERLALLSQRTTAILYAAGATSHVWRRWAALASFTAFAYGELHQAVRYAALAGEWPFVEHLTRKHNPGEQTVDRILWLLAGGIAVGCLPSQLDEYTMAWLTLADSIPERDHDRTEQALGWLAEDWITGQHPWPAYRINAFPVFEPPLCAAAALARRAGYVPRGLGPEVLRALDAGLESDEPPPLFPAQLQLPDAAAVARA